MAGNTSVLQSLYQRQKLSLFDIMDKIVDVKADDVELASHRYSASQDLITMIEASTLPDSEAKFTITCCKSGAFIRNVTLAEFAMLEKIHGGHKAMDILELRCNTHIAAHWIQTDGATLEKLNEHDPHGYFIYAIDKMLRAAQDIFRNFAQIKDTTQQQALEYKWHRIKHIAWKEIQKQPIDKIIKCNELMRRYLSIIDTSKANHIVKFETTDILEITQYKLLNFINDIQTNIRRVLDWCWKNNRINRDITIDDVIKLKNLFKGHSNFSAQRKMANIPDYERIINELSPFFDDVTMRRLHQPTITEEQLKELQTGRVKSTTLPKGFKFNLKVTK